MALSVKVVAQTQTWDEDLETSGYVAHGSIGEPCIEGREDDQEWWDWLNSLPNRADELAEAAGRLCYKSFNRPNPKTAENQTYLANIIAQQHFSVLEHASVTFYVTGASRNLLIELERHRHLSFSVVSQRYVDQNPFGYVVPPGFDKLDDYTAELLKEDLELHYERSMSLYNAIYDAMINAGVKRKEAREAARAALPGMIETEFYVTGNHRTWREILQKRMTPYADREIHQFANAVYEELKKIAPHTYQDLDV